MLSSTMTMRSTNKYLLITSSTSSPSVTVSSPRFFPSCKPAPPLVSSASNSQLLAGVGGVGGGRSLSTVTQIRQVRGWRKAEAGEVAAGSAAAATTAEKEAVSRVKATISAKLTVEGFFERLELSRGLDDVTDLVGKSVLLELVSAELDPKTGEEKEALKAYARRTKLDKDKDYVEFEADFTVPPEFGEVAAVLVENEHHMPMYFNTIDLDGPLPFGSVSFTCNSWVHSKFDNPEKRIFFTNKSYLPANTPNGLRRLRETELKNLRGNGQGERKSFERIYDYDTYNDLGDPDSKPELKRPVLGGDQHPYPRRCRTGRPATKTDPSSEKKGTIYYVPRDEQFADVKLETFSAKSLYSVLHAVVPSLETAIVDSNLGFPYFTAIDSLFNEGVNLPKLTTKLSVKDILPRLIKKVEDIKEDVLRFETPAMFEKDRFSWFRDEEFSRQTLAGLNPCALRLVTVRSQTCLAVAALYAQEWPLKSTLDPEIYGPQESFIDLSLSYLLLHQILYPKRQNHPLTQNLGISQGLDGIADLLFQDAFQLELVSTELNSGPPATEKQPIKAYAKRAIDQNVEDEVKYEAQFSVPADFGEIGAILVENERRREIFLKDIVLTGLPCGEVTINCDSWVASKLDNSEKRIFFTNKSYLPCQTPGGLKRLRERELQNLRGNGKGERKFFDRIYDYDTYNDLGDPDLSLKLQRPVLGGKEHPYPRRCRTGRPHSKRDPLSETRRSIDFYVPRDEEFADVKLISFGATGLGAVLHALVPTLQAIIDKNLGFPTFAAIESLFKDGIELPPFKNQKTMRKTLSGLLRDGAEATKDVLLFKKPALVDRDELAWLRNEEFARQTLAGVNPCSIKTLEEWPIKSKLDPEIYGSPESAITTEIIEQQIKGYPNFEEAIGQKKIFILDYHDVFLPYVNKVRETEGTPLYGSRTLFFLTSEGVLEPLAIELTRPPSNGKPQWKQVFTPGCDATQTWLWRMAKVHVLAHDSAHHQLISHWLRTHCCTEPYIIAANRQLSAVHPIYRLLYPHFRYTMQINALAREALINAAGIIEDTFSARKYCMELSSTVYDQTWRFDLQALPADLISRGLAVEDPAAPHGLKLTIEDYPYANDGLLLWNAIREWVSEYVNHYYPEEDLVESDEELQAWWAEIKYKGHKDKKDESWWPILNTPKNLIQIITSIIWMGSCHHAAVNFVQYTYGGYFPNRPTIARTKMPTEDPTEEEWNHFLDKPYVALLQSFPSQIQATTVMAVLDILSTHSPDEEYIGDQMEPSWAEDPPVKAAFERFNRNLKGIDETIDRRNADKNLKNRHGVGTLPYQVLKPFSKPGMTGMGVPNSISI